jgi:hypothetical protein
VSAPDATAAVLALLRADANLTVHDGKVPTDPTTGKLPARPYVVVYGPPDGDGDRIVDSLSGSSSRSDGVVTTTVVGDTAESVRIVAKRVRAALLDVSPTVTGRSSFPIRVSSSQDVRRDDDVQPPVMYAVDRWLVQSVPA